MLKTLMTVVLVLAAALAQAAVDVGRGVWPKGVEPVLSETDAARYTRLLRQAENGVKPDSALLRQLDNRMLVPHVMGQYYLRTNQRISYADLSDWLRANGDLPQARAMYQLAEARRPPAPTSCETKTRTIKVKNKKTKKLENKKVKRRECRVVGSRPALPPLPKAMLAQQARRAALEAAREAEYDGMPAAQAAMRRKLLGDSWRQRQRGDYAAAFATLTGAGARGIIGSARWQSELVKIAEQHFNKRNYSQAQTVATRAAEVNGPERDTALWLAGMANYRLGNARKALSFWETMVREEPKKGLYAARGAWWAARAAAETGNQRLAREMLQKAMQDPFSFYGQLAAAKLGMQVELDFRAPGFKAADINVMRRIPALRRGLALAQVGEIGLAQDEFRAARESIPYQSTASLAALALQLHLPGTAVQSGRELLERNQPVAGALYPVPYAWRPSEKGRVERSLMYGIMRQESAFQPQVGSRVGAQGLMQLMPATAAYISRLAGRPKPDRGDLHDTTVNMTLAQDYLDYLNNKLEGNLILVVAAYNGGVGNVRRWLSRGTVPGNDPMMFIEHIPFAETKDYVEKVMANFWIYQRQMGETPHSLKVLAEGAWPVKRASGYAAVRQVN